MVTLIVIVNFRRVMCICLSRLIRPRLIFDRFANPGLRTRLSGPETGLGSFLMKCHYGAYILIGRYRSSVRCFAPERTAPAPSQTSCVSSEASTSQSAFSDSVYHIYHSSSKIIANSCTGLLAKGFIFISAESKKRQD